MSRIAMKPLAIPTGITASLSGGLFSAKGTKGNGSYAIPGGITVELGKTEVLVKRPDNSIMSKTLQGTCFRRIANLMDGVTKGFQKDLKIEGVGFRAEVKGSQLVMQLGYSHPMTVPIPEGVTVKINKMTEIHIEGTSKEVIGQFAANVRSTYEPEPYKGKGVRYLNEVVRRKAGKAVVKQ